MDEKYQQNPRYVLSLKQRANVTLVGEILNRKDDTLSLKVFRMRESWDEPVKQGEIAFQSGCYTKCKSAPCDAAIPPFRHPPPP